MFTMPKNGKLFIPNNFSVNKTGFIQGFYRNQINCDAYYITNPNVQDQCKNHIGYCGQIIGDFLGPNMIFLEKGTDKFRINGCDEVTEIFYDFDEFKRVKTVGDCGDELMMDFVNKHTDKRENNAVLMAVVEFSTEILSKIHFLGKHSATLSHLNNELLSVKGDKISPQMYNFVTAKIIDFVLGMGLIYLCINYECLIVSQFNYMSQHFVTYLRKLLIYLMGSPIGLKLNYAFNHSLGKFFFYHINLWRVFLQAMQPLLEENFKLILIPSFLGLSCQIALFCDLISLATFHVYCIYVYAARLFSLQIRGLMALWRLFMGRKWNPLKSRVDSCEYSSNQLFIGTLGFTVILFLLPTTAMYYTVFAAFRLIILLTYNFLDKIKDLLSRVPLYVFILWIFGSKSIAGTITINVAEDNGRIDIRLATLPLRECIRKLSNTVGENEKQKFYLGAVVSHVLTGKLI